MIFKFASVLLPKCADKRHRLTADTKTPEARRVALACGEFGEVEAAALEVAGAQIKYINT
jgi:hypothetical protein